MSLNGNNENIWTTFCVTFTFRWINSQIIRLDWQLRRSDYYCFQRTNNLTFSRIFIRSRCNLKHENFSSFFVCKYRIAMLSKLSEKQSWSKAILFNGFVPPLMECTINLFFFSSSLQFFTLIHFMKPGNLLKVIIHEFYCMKCDLNEEKKKSLYRKSERGKEREKKDMFERLWLLIATRTC